MTKRLLLGVVLILLGILALTELFLPFFMEKQVQAGLGRALGTNDIQASVKARPALSMLGGNFSTITVNGKNIHSGKLTISELSAVFMNTSIDLNKLLISRSLVFRDIGSFDGTIILREEDINQSVAQSVKGLKNVQVTLVPEHMTVTGDFSFGPAVVAVAMDGKLRGDETQLKYVPAMGAKLNSSGLGGFVLFDTKQLPIAATIRDVVIEQGRVVIRMAK
jgi:hypothetical protein